VLHKYTFRLFYSNVATGDIVEVHTNMIEGALRHAKTHFRKIRGTKLTQFERHLVEVTWISEEKGNLYVSFFNLLRSVYHLNGYPTFTYGFPLFGSWDIAIDIA